MEWKNMIVAKGFPQKGERVGKVLNNESFCEQLFFDLPLAGVQYANA